MNALQRLIADFLGDHPEETFSSIARRAKMPRQTVQALARRKQVRAAPREATIVALARGLRMDVDIVKAAAGLTAGYGQGTAALENEQMRMLVEVASELDEERLTAVLRRARALMEEAREEEQAKKSKAGRTKRSVAAVDAPADRRNQTPQ
ncbi:MAG: hypothetical protein ACXV3V_11050 [Actinomycetes bacterium]